MVNLYQIEKLNPNQLPLYGKEIAKSIPNRNRLLSNEFNTPGTILREIKKLQSLNEDDFNFSGSDVLGGYNAAIRDFRKDRKAAIDALGKKYEQFIDKGQEGTQKGKGLDAIIKFGDITGEGRDRFDLPPLKDGLLGVKAASSPEGRAQDEVLKKVRAAKKLSGTKKALYEGPFGKLGEYFANNEKKRDELFDYISSVGRQLVKPTNPGEARGLVSDISAGLEAGEAKIAGKDAAALDALVKQGQYASNTNPMQNYTTAMKEIRQEAISNGLEPGTKEYTDFVGAALRGKRVSKEMEPLIKALESAKDQQFALGGAGIDPSLDKIVKNFQDQLIAMQSGGGPSMVKLGGSDNDISYLGGKLASQ